MIIFAFLRENVFFLQGVKCDMITGEQRLYANSEFDPSDHVACTVEMYNLSKECKLSIQVHDL